MTQRNVKKDTSMLKELAIPKIVGIVLGNRAWLDYIDSFKSWSRDWTSNQIS